MKCQKYFRSCFAVLVCLFFLRPAEASAQTSTCLFPDKAIQLYGQQICPDRFNQDDGFKRWGAMVGRLDRFLPGALEDTKKTPAEICDHVNNLRRKYSGSAEQYVFMLQSGLMSGMENNPKIMEFLQPFLANEDEMLLDAPADLVILKIMFSEDPSVMQTLLSFYPEETQMQILMVQNFIETTQHLSTLYDSVLDACSEHAKENKMYKVLNYNGPDAGYDYTQDPGWEALREKWKRNKELGIVE